MTSRKEPDQFELLSGLVEGVTTGAPLSFLIRNLDVKSDAYLDFLGVYRPGHADYAWDKKYGIWDPLGGGRASARETVARVIAGAVAKQILPSSVGINSRLVQVGQYMDMQSIQEAVLQAKQKGDSLGGLVEVVATGVPVGLGEPVYEKLDARIAYAMMSIPAVKCVEIGSGRECVEMSGSSHNDQMDETGFLSNHSGGVLGGVSTGQPIVVRVSFKPTASIFLPQKTVDKEGNPVCLKLKGRHDPCVAYRAPVIVESMLAVVLADFFLIARTRRL
jgi:chorismate synthase